eukprot:TRINITY_DN1896_c0_g1_i1.p1 TRINITY_DN1896_c0_g1~~TRINITY_DN1896_c0_g1_i1.p1  ORF type:complete len:266 (+),score=75.91 TRINITY_DN1896_c0_g1_i1:130-927(+)
MGTSVDELEDLLKTIQESVQSGRGAPVRNTNSNVFNSPNSTSNSSASRFGTQVFPSGANRPAGGSISNNNYSNQSNNSTSRMPASTVASSFSPSQALPRNASQTTPVSPTLSKSPSAGGDSPLIVNLNKKIQELNAVLRSKDAQIAQLESQKAEAVSRDDFETAMRVKKNITELQAELQDLTTKTLKKIALCRKGIEIEEMLINARKIPSSGGSPAGTAVNRVAIEKKIKELTQQKADCVRIEDYAGAQKLKELILIEEQKLNNF